MGSKLMGRKAGLITAAEAAEILGCTQRRVYQYTDSGLLSASHDGNRRKKMYGRDQIYAVKEAFDGLDGKLDLPRLLAEILQLKARCSSLEQRLGHVEAVNHLDVPILSYEKDEVLAVYWAAKDLARDPTSEFMVVLDFSKTLRGIHQEFLELVELHTEDREPWRVFREAAQRLRKNCTGTQLFEYIEIATAQAELQAARGQFENVVFNFVCARDGKREAYRRFPHLEPDIHKRILRFMPTTPGCTAPDTH